MDTKLKYNSKVLQSPEVFNLITRIRNLKKRNLLRGYSAKLKVTSNDAYVIRMDNTPHDSKLIGALLKGKNGLLSKNLLTKKSSSDLFVMTSFPSMDWRNEVCYTAGYINSLVSCAIKAIESIETVLEIEKMTSEAALNALLMIAKNYGASNFLSYKLAYIRTSRELSTMLLSEVAKIEDEFQHRENPGFHFNALENLSSKISIFLVAQRKISGLGGRLKGDFRKSLSFSNFVPTPLNCDDVAGFMLRATESSLIDTLHSLIVILNLTEGFSEVQKCIETNLNSEVLHKITKLRQAAAEIEDGKIITDYYRSLGEDSDSLDLYRISAAFLERPRYAIYRNTFDRVVSVRLIAEVVDKDLLSLSQPGISKDDILKKNNILIEAGLTVRLDSFYRTFLFLRLVRNRSSLLTLESKDIKYIFENTIGLEILLTEEEMRAICVIAPPSVKSLVTVLALALFRKKSIDPDIDFEFRNEFIALVKEAHRGSVLELIEDLLRDSPQIASYIVGSLDEVTIEKMYSLVTNASQASQIRCEILRALGKKLNRIEYLIEADAITTRTKVSKLQHYFDSSRMYVDSISMKKWLDSNPTVATEQYRNLYTRIEASSASIESIVDLMLMHLNDQSEYLITQIAKDSFEQFCLNTEFGIESYLGRRIRHNTLDGVTIDTVDAVLRKPEYHIVVANPVIRRTIETWMGNYKSIVDKLRRNHLQFKTTGRLFNSVLDPEDLPTKENIRILSSTLQATGGSELLNDLIIAFCWKQIGPQLENASRFIKNTLLLEADASIDKHFAMFSGATEMQIKAELHEAVNEVFKKVADWFQVPQTGFISASVRDLCQIILIDLNRDSATNFIGDSLDVKYTGISVHRLYDCLAVLLQNAHKHGEENGEICVEVNSRKVESESVLSPLVISITSTVSENKYEQSKQRIHNAIETVEAGSDMVTEGYSGIKKIKFITKVSEGRHTVRCYEDDASNKIKLVFSLHAETATEDAITGPGQ